MSKVVTLYPANQQQYTDAAWAFCSMLLWEGLVLEDCQVKMATRFIRKYLSAPGNLESNFISFCERIVIAHNYLPSPPVPAEWFSQAYSRGFAATDLPYILSLCNAVRAKSPALAFQRKICATTWEKARKRRPLSRVYTTKMAKASFDPMFQLLLATYQLP